MTVVAPPTTRQTAWPARPKLRIRRSPTGEESPRPLTATLDHPVVLNADLMNKLDMTVFTKEGLLAISRLCSVPLMSKSLTPLKRKRRPLVKNMEPDDSSSSDKRKPLKEATKIKRLPKDGKIAPVPKTAPPPEPCKTCGKPEYAERLHSHGTAYQSTSVVILGKIGSVRSSRSGKDEVVIDNRSKSGSHGKAVMISCYICSKEINFLNYPEHEEHCEADWHKAQAVLPPGKRKPLPHKPDESISESIQGKIVVSGNISESINKPQNVIKNKNKSVSGNKPNANEVGQHRKPESIPSSTPPKETRYESKFPSSKPNWIDPNETKPAPSSKQKFISPQNETKPTPSNKPKFVGLPSQNESRSAPNNKSKVVPENEKNPAPSNRPKTLAHSEGRPAPTNNVKFEARRKMELVLCPQCGKSLLPSLLGIHSRSCKGAKSITESAVPSKKPESASASSAINGPQTPMRGRPPSVFCYICGREFGTRSIAIHEPQCLKKWKAENDALPKKQRRPTPVKPGNDGLDLKDFNVDNWEAWNKNLVPCKTCGRTFLPDRIDRHEKTCKNTPIVLKYTQPK